jgi:ubiquinone/menaquinone biosynthesis C-methylase UbiE
MAVHQQRLLTQVIAEAPLNGRCLDIGCGTGGFLRALAEARPDLTLLGLDASPSALLEASKKRLPQRLSFLQSAAEGLPFSDGVMDLIVATGVIKHCHPPELALSEMHRVLRHHGRMILHEMDPEVNPKRFSSLTTAYPALTSAIIRRWVLPKSLAAEAIRTLLACSSWQIEDDGAVPDLPLYGFVLRKT